MIHANETLDCVLVLEKGGIQCVAGPLGNMEFIIEPCWVITYSKRGSFRLNNWSV